MPDTPFNESTSTAQSVVDQNLPLSQAPPEPVTKKNKEFKAFIESTKNYRRRLIQNWTTNIDYRRAKPYTSQSDEDRIFVPLDWAMTKSKHASLYSQTPRVHIDHPPQTQKAGPWLALFEQRLNDTLITGGIESAMEEVMPDVINAAGIGIALCSHESIFEYVDVPAVDFATLPTVLAEQVKSTGKMLDGSPIPMENVPRMIDHRYSVSRVSPADFLWPLSFTGSDFDNCPWLGRSGRMAWSEAVNRFKLDESEKKRLVGDKREFQDRLSHDTDREKDCEDVVMFDEIFYKEYLFDDKARSYVAIHHLIFLEGRDEPVVDEPWQGQQLDPTTNQYVGAVRFPIRVLTLTYLTDDTIPPSDSSMGRSQVDEINKARSQMIMQRERSMPIRWFDPNRIAPEIQQSLMRGIWQAMIPVAGNGASSIGEVSRAQFPPEDFTFNQIARNDIDDIWQSGPNQQGNYSEDANSATEAKLVQGNYSTRIGKERARVGKFLVSIAEVIGGLLSLYEPPESFGEGYDKGISRTLSYSILADSTVLLDSNQRREVLKDFINFAAKSGWVDIEPVLKEYATLSGLDPNVVIKAPQPPPPAEPNISLRLTGTEDLITPMALAMLLKSGQGPTPELIEQAKKLIQLAVVPPLDQMGAQMPGQTPPMPPGAGGPPPLAGPQGPPPMPMQTISPPLPPPPSIGKAHPNWEMMSKINKRGDHE